MSDLLTQIIGSGGAEPASTSAAARVYSAVAGGRPMHRWARMAQACVLGGAVFELGGKAVNRVRSDLTYTVTVRSSDYLYHELRLWLIRNVAERGRRQLLAATGRRRSGDMDAVAADETSRSRPVDRLHLLYNGARQTRVRLDGHWVWFHIEREEEAKPSGDSLSSKPESIVITTLTPAARDAAVRLLEEITEATSSGPMLNVTGRWGWVRVAGVPARPMNSVVLRKGQLERIDEDLSRFLSHETAYMRLGIPYHRGYLFHGPPGTGKTSTARALAHSHGLDVFFLSLPDLKDDNSLADMLAQIEPRSALVIEDIDVASAARERDDQNDGPSMSGLLNALDGMSTPHGLVAMLTTNNVGVLDTALIRPGRTDLVEEFDHLDDEQADRLVQAMLGRPLPLPSVAGLGLTPADLLEAVKAHIGDTDAAAAAVLERCHELTTQGRDR